MTALVTMPELVARLPFEMDTDEEREATGALADLSDDARHYGTSRWTVETAPVSVKNLILRAAVRHMKNPDGFTTSRAGDETVMWTDRGEGAGSATFTEEEKRVLRALSGRVGFGTVPMVAWGSSDRNVDNTGYVPSRHGLFPLYSSDTEPW